MKMSPKLPPFIVILSLTAGLFLVSGCTKKEDIAPTTTTVYTAGYTYNTSGQVVPCYWKNEERVDLPVIDSNRDGYAFAIAVEGNTVYTGGYTINTSDDRIPCYWKNQERIDLPVFNPSEYGVVQDIKVINEAVFTAGYTTSSFGFRSPCYWINKTRVDLPVLIPADSHGAAYALDVVENTVYVAGYAGDAPCYWINNSLILLPAPPTGCQATDIKVVANNVYVAGYVLNDTFDRVPSYWLNGTRIDLPLLDKYDLGALLGYSNDDILLLPDVTGAAYSLDVVKSIVYTAGVNTLAGGNYPFYWFNQIAVDLLAPPPSSWHSVGAVSAIDVVENVVYTAGGIINSDEVGIPCYWINHDTRIDLPVLATSGGEARAIQVVVK